MQSSGTEAAIDELIRILAAKGILTKEEANAVLKQKAKGEVSGVAALTELLNDLVASGKRGSRSQLLDRLPEGFRSRDGRRGGRRKGGGAIPAEACFRRIVKLAARALQFFLSADEFP